MSWMVAVCFPALLMLFTLGLQRLESLVHCDRPSAADGVARLERAARAAREKTAQRAVGERLVQQPTGRFDPVFLIDEPGLPTRPNPLLQPTGFANPV